MTVKERLEYIIVHKGYCTFYQERFALCEHCCMDDECTSFIHENGIDSFTNEVIYKKAIEIYVKVYSKEDLMELII